MRYAVAAHLEGNVIYSLCHRRGCEGTCLFITFRTWLDIPITKGSIYERAKPDSYTAQRLDQRNLWAKGEDETDLYTYNYTP